MEDSNRYFQWKQILFQFVKAIGKYELIPKEAYERNLLSLMQKLKEKRKFI